MTARVLYVVSQFPKTTETFVVNEWLALRERFEMQLAALRRGDAALKGATTASVAGVIYPPLGSRAALAAHASWLRRAPRRYFSIVSALGRGWRGAPDGNRVREVVKMLVAFHQGVGLARYVDSAGIDHVHAHFANHPATAAWVVHRLTGRSFSFTAHANDLFRAPALLATKVSDAAFVVAISEYNARLLDELVPGAHIRVVHCGVDCHRFAPREEQPAEAARDNMLCVAGLQAKKGHTVLLRAFAQLANDRPSLHLTLIGEGPERPAVEEAVRALGLEDRVTLAGARDSEDVANHLGRADVFVLAALRDSTGRMDGIPVAIMEAMAAGVPVVTTSVSGIPELVTDGTTGLVVEPGDASALANAMTRILDDDRLRACVAEAARARVANDFDLYAEATKLGDLFESSVASAG